jgi:hypothetical protein
MEDGHCHYGKVKHRRIESIAAMHDMARSMIRSGPAFLALLTTAAPALAQNEPFRVVNGARLPAIGLHIVRSGEDGWGPNQLTRGPLASGAMLSMRPPESAGCLFDMRLLLQDGVEAIRRQVNVCESRTVVLAGAAAVLGPGATPAPRPGDGDRPRPTIGGDD